jgi:hypothetical protein
MHDDPGYQRFFSYISLFTFSMLMLVMSNNLLQLFFGWEAVGVVSYLLIGFWYKRPTAIFANMKAFLVNRVGDFGFLLGISALALYTGSLDYVAVFAEAETLSTQTMEILPGSAWSVITVACICLFIGAMGKSAQVPLHVWLPDSMEGPTPISALIHAATMVTAGIFMVARMSPLFEYSATALEFVIVIGATNTDPRKPYKEFSKTVSRLEDADARAKRRAEDMRAEGRIFFEQWQQEITELHNSELQQLAMERKESLQQTFRKISRYTVEAKDQLRPWLTNVKDLERFLGSDLSVSGIYAAKRLVDETRVNSDKVTQSLQTLIDELNSLEAAMTPPREKVNRGSSG